MTTPSDKADEALEHPDDPELLVPDEKPVKMTKEQRRRARLSGHIPSKNEYGKTLYDHEQRAKIAEWICAGLTNAQIYDRMIRRGWPTCNRNNLERYRKRYGVNLSAMHKLELQEAMQKGYAQRTERVRALGRMADRLQDIIETELVVERLKYVGPAQGGKFVIELEVNSSLLKEFRQILRQIAQEVGDLSPDFLIGSVLNALPEDVRRAVIELAAKSDKPGAVRPSGLDSSD